MTTVFADEFDDEQEEVKMETVIKNTAPTKTNVDLDRRRFICWLFAVHITNDYNKNHSHYQIRGS